MDESPKAPRRRLLRWTLVGIALLAIPALIFQSELTRLWQAASLFDPDRIVHNFQHMDELLDSRTIEQGGDVLEFARGKYSLAATFRTPTVPSTPRRSSTSWSRRG